MVLASIFCNRRTQKACRGNQRLIPKIIIFLSRNPGACSVAAEVLDNPSIMVESELRKALKIRLLVQCESMVAVEVKLKEIGIEYVQRTVKEGGIYVDQLFFHDPDGFMVELCNCENLPVVDLNGEPIGGVCSRRIFKHQQLIAQQQKQQPPPSPPQMVQCTPAIPVNEDFLSCA
uniref:Metallothiol transferase FosB-like n=1 Tax=Nelumbo nucifera TaxID=4432 RepID=A0A822Y542_NELNU|nr:TPA_asm: hypothetical protein HUJ06_028601 [Nelumbo nucifera]